MNFLKLISYAAAAVFIIAAVSCKKDDEETTYPYLSGLSFDCPVYVSPEQVVTLTPKGVTHPEGGEVSYSWKVSPSMPKSDTADVFTHKFSDTLGRYTVMCYAFASGYTGDSYSITVNVVKGGLNGSITNTDISETDPNKIVHEGNTYYYKRIGDLEWFRNSLATSSEGTPYVNLDVNSDVFGRYYSYNEAKTACPEGWRLPTEDDWLALAAAVGAESSEKYGVIGDVTSKLLANAYFNGDLMVSYLPEVGDITNDSGLSLIPVGYSNLGDPDAAGDYPAASFFGMNEYAVVWTADAVEGEDMAYYRYLIHNQPDMFTAKGDVNSFGASVRCVRDAE